ncbi:hypothetical protein GCM10022140_51850 [Rhodococcus aetherivorans]
MGFPRERAVDEGIFAVEHRLAFGRGEQELGRLAVHQRGQLEGIQRNAFSGLCAPLRRQQVLQRAVLNSRFQQEALEDISVELAPGSDATRVDSRHLLKLDLVGGEL